MANKKINASDVNTPSISLVQQAVDPAPLSTRLQLYAYNNLLRLMRTDGTVQTMVDLTTAQTLANKTLSTLVIANTGGTNHFLRQDTLGGTVSSSVIALSQICQGRLTLTSNTPITTSDVTGAGTLYWTPFRGNGISLYESGVWTVYEFSQISLALTLTNALPYDVFAYSSGGSVAIETTAWTNTTTRATAITLQNGVYVKSGATERRYLGSLYASGANTTEDSLTKRYLWNYYNQVERPLYLTDSSSHTYNSATVRSWNNNAALRLQMMIGISSAMRLGMSGTVKTGVAGGNAYIGAGLDSTTATDDSIGTVLNYNTQFILASNGSSKQIAEGFHYLQALESADANVGTFSQVQLRGNLMA